MSDPALPDPGPATRPGPDAGGSSQEGGLLRPSWWSWRRFVVRGLSPSELGWAFGVGAALAVAPIPGLQIAVIGVIAWRTRLNLPAMIAGNNISFGPLLPVWAAIAISLGHWMDSGEAPWRTYHAYVLAFTTAHGRAWWGLIGRSLGEWGLGSLILMPILGLVSGVLVAVIAHSLSRRPGPHPPAS